MLLISMVNTVLLENLFSIISNKLNILILTERLISYICNNFLATLDEERPLIL